MMTLMLLLPFMIGEYLPEDDIHWECFLVLWDICAMVCAHEVTSQNSVKLGWIVKTYLESFTQLYGREKITPKMHHLVHLPEQIMLYVNIHIYTDGCKYMYVHSVDLVHYGISGA